MTYTCMARGRDGGDAKRGSTGAPQSHMLVRRLTRSSERLGACTDGSPTTAGGDRGGSGSQADWASEEEDGPSIAEQLGREMMRYFGGGEAGQERCAGLHIVGHSMGAQLVLEATRLLLDSAESGGASAGHGRALATASAIAREKIVLVHT